MNAPALGLFLGCIVAVSAVPAQEKTVPELRALQDQFDAQVKLEVQQAYDLGVVDLNVKYTAALDRALEAAQKAGKLEDAVAITGDKEAVALGKGVPATDDEKTLPVVKQLRATYRLAISRLEVERVRRLQPLQAAFARSLDALVTSLTKEGKFDDAMVVKKQHTELSAAPASQTPLPAQSTTATASKPAVAAVPPPELRWFVGKTWLTDARTKWSFAKDGTGDKVRGSFKIATFTWRVLESGVVELSARAAPDKPISISYLQFKSKSEAWFGDSVDKLNDRLHYE